MFFKAAFKNDAQNNLREHDFHLILAFYTERIEGKTGMKMPEALVDAMPAELGEVFRRLELL